MTTDSIALMRALLVKSSQGSSPPKTVAGGSEGTSMSNLIVDSSSEGTLAYRYTEDDSSDQPRARFWYRRITGHLSLTSWVPVITGTIAGIEYTKAEHDASAASRVQTLR